MNELFKKAEMPGTRRLAMRCVLNVRKQVKAVVTPQINLFQQL